MIVWNFLFALCYFSTGSTLLDWKNITTVVEFSVLAPLYLLAGLAADCWVGRYRILQMAVYVLLPAIVIKALEPLINIKVDPLPHIMIFCLALSGACSEACTLQFTTDQLVGASGEQLSFTIYWLVWGYIAGVLIGLDAQYLFGEDVRSTVLLAISSLSMVAAICMMKYGSHWLMTKPLLSNPIKHIAMVLNYARKHKYPE